MTNQISMKVVNFAQEMARIEAEIKLLSTFSMHERMDKATEELKIVTPVDTGKARRGWSNTKSMGLSDKVGTIQNPVDYISVLNNGHSKQAPRYFIEQVLMKIGIITPN